MEEIEMKQPGEDALPIYIKSDPVKVIKNLYARDKNNVPWGILTLRFNRGDEAYYEAGGNVLVEYAWAICHPGDKLMGIKADTFSKKGGRVRTIECMTKHRAFSGHAEFNKEWTFQDEEFTLRKAQGFFLHAMEIVGLVSAAQAIRACANSSRSYKLAKIAFERAKECSKYAWRSDTAPKKTNPEITQPVATASV